MVYQTLYSTKKTFYHNFFPTKAEEESSKSRPKTLTGLLDNRMLIEMRDIYTPLVIGTSDNPWLIKKTLNHYELMFGKIILSCTDTFEHVLRYWTLDMANQITLGRKICVILWDVTDEKNPKKYQSSDDFYLQMMANDDCILSCMELMKDGKLKVDDEIYLHWDPKDTSFKFKLFL